METRIDKSPPKARAEGRKSGRSLSIPTTMRFKTGCIYARKGVRAKVVSKSPKFVTLHFYGGKEPDRRCKLHMSNRIEICYPYGKEKGVVLHATDMVGGSPSRKKTPKKKPAKKTETRKKTTARRKPVESSWFAPSKKKSDDKPRRTITEPAETRKRTLRPFVLARREKEPPEVQDKPKRRLSFKGVFGRPKESGSAPAETSGAVKMRFLDDKVD